MDSITHILSAALWTEPWQPPAPTGKAYARWRERAALGLGALLPDADGVLGWIDPVLYHKYHRLFTHSLPGMAVVLGLATVLARYWPERALLPFLRTRAAGLPIQPPAWGRLAGIAAAAAGLHFLGDWITAWGIWPLWPFSGRDFALGWANSLDPMLLLVTTAAWAAQHLCLAHHRRRLAWAVPFVWLGLCAGYLLWRAAFGEKAFI